MQFVFLKIKSLKKKKKKKNCVALFNSVHFQDIHTIPPALQIRWTRTERFDGGLERLPLHFRPASNEPLEQMVSSRVLHQVRTLPSPAK